MCNGGRMYQHWEVQTSQRLYISGGHKNVDCNTNFTESILVREADFIQSAVNDNYSAS